jgi:hypothetical protein
MARACNSIREIRTEFFYRKLLESSHFKTGKLIKNNIEVDLREIVVEDGRWM